MKRKSEREERKSVGGDSRESDSSYECCVRTGTGEGLAEHVTTGERPPLPPPPPRLLTRPLPLTRRSFASTLPFYTSVLSSPIGSPVGQLYWHWLTAAQETVRCASVMTHDTDSWLHSSRPSIALSFHLRLSCENYM